jgi:hypothetical protein
MAVVFSKISETSVSVSWNSGDLETCGNGFSYRYTYTLKKNGTTVSVIGPTSTIGNTWTGLTDGSYNLEILVEQFDDTPAWILCQYYINITTLILNTSFCIPSNATNIKFSDLAIHYGVPIGEIRLSGPNNPSTGDNIFGQSGLPASGTISRATPNAVSELRGHCAGGVDNFNGWTVNLQYGGETFTTALGGFVVFINYNVVWKNITTGAVQTTCPLSSSSVTFNVGVNVITQFQGSSLFTPSPYNTRILRSDTVVHTTSRAATSVGTTSNNFVCTLSAGQTAILQIMRQEEVLGQNCDTNMQIRQFGSITAANVGGTVRPVISPSFQESTFNKEANACTTPVATTSFFRYTGELAQNISAGFKVDGSNGLFYLLNPASPGNSFSLCAGFDNQRQDIRQSNGTIGVETSGSKTIKIGFSTTNLQVTMTVNITVRRLSDNAVVASTSVTRSPGTNLYDTVSTLTWSNAVNNTKIGVTVEVSMPCIV